jgi:Dyp-type peroxidase family
MNADLEIEPILDIDQIQGNILGGFNKDHQAVLPLHFGSDESSVRGTREWIAQLLPQITWLQTVAAYKHTRELRIRTQGVEPSDMPAVWLNVAFSYLGLRKLTPQADGFEPIFRAGLPAASQRLGDPTDPSSPGCPANWLVGNPRNVPDILVILAADLATDLDARLTQILADASTFGLTYDRYDVGHDLSFYNNSTRPVFPSGREHFGFEDGISQPGVRGRLPHGPQKFLTARQSDEASDPNSTEPQYSAPGQALVNVGEFVLGYPRQDDSFPQRPAPPWKLGPEPYALDETAVAPYWAKNGSFLVFRRLRQNVSAFNQFIEDQVKNLNSIQEFAGITAERLGAMLVGRWRSGAPLLRTPNMDDPSLGTAKYSNNAFQFDTVLATSDGFTLPIADPLGKVMPQCAHIRKVNPRDLDTDQGSLTTTLTHRILRRGIPYGRPLPIGATNENSSIDRGLLFLSYQASIREQFEFLCATWMNDVSKPSIVAPPKGSGYDMVVGQNATPADQRARFCLVGASNQRISTDGDRVRDWVIPTGGGYFFAPSKSVITDVLI